MPFDTKKTLADWKKAKPLMLTDTGVSSVLRALPEEPKHGQLGEFTKALQKLDGFMADPKVKKESKAVACLKQIKDEINKYLATVKSDRGHVIHDMDTIYPMVESYLAAVEKGPATAKLVNLFFGKIGPVRRGMNLHTQAQDDAAVPRVYFMDWNTGESVFKDSVMTMAKVMEGVERTGTPTPESQKQMAEQIVYCKRALALMDKARKAAKAL